MATRLLLDENMPGSLAPVLRDTGYDVLAVKESMRGADDVAVLARGQAEARVLLTMDKDFGELAVRFGLPARSGVILFRLSGDDPHIDTRRILGVLASRSDWDGHFTVATDDRVRMRVLPPISP